MTVHALVLQSHDSNVLSYSECKIAKIFWGFAPGSQGGLKAYPPLKIPQLHKIGGYGTVTTLFATQKTCLPPMGYWRNQNSEY